VLSKELNQLVDTHCHLNFTSFDQDRDLVVERARKIGVVRILNPAVDIETSRSAIECANAFSEVYAAVGVHPNDGSGWTKDTIAQLRMLAGSQKVVAIGEIGLDYYRDRTPKKTQENILKEQLELAEVLEKPVIIHNRDASDDMLKVLRTWHDGLILRASKLAGAPGVLHAYSGDIALAEEMVSMNFKLGIAGPITFSKSLTLQSIVASLPLNSFLIETDAPFLSPHPNRGKRNEPANVRIVAEKIAELKKITLENVIINTASQADLLFRWSEIH
jgi:TatD DNase family protein